MKHLLGALACAGGLAACGGGFYIGIDDFDDPPSVSLAASVTQAQPGQALRLTAAASDDDEVRRVDFYRFESDGNSTLLCRDTEAPYDCNSSLPADARRGSTVNFFARATDSFGNRTDSAFVGVVVV
ncbi:MAG: Ig-like domain-containing protein [Rubrivivax sp.]